MIENRSPDKEKAKALRKMALATHERLQATDLARFPSLALLDYYNIIHLLLEARASEAGIKATGEGAHSDLISFSNIPEADKRFVQTLRGYRNRISYEGFTIKKEFIENIRERLEQIIDFIS